MKNKFFSSLKLTKNLKLTNSFKKNIVNFAVKRACRYLSGLIFIIFFLQIIVCFYVQFPLKNVSFLLKDFFYNPVKNSLILKDCNFNDLDLSNQMICNSILLDLSKLGFCYKIRSEFDGVFFRIPNEKNLFKTIDKVNNALNSGGKYQLDLINFKNCFFQISTPLGFVEFCFNGKLAKDNFFFSKLKILNLSLNNQVLIKDADLYFKSHQDSLILKIASENINLILDKKDCVYKFLTKICDVDFQGYFDKEKLILSSKSLRQSYFLKPKISYINQNYFFSLDNLLTQEKVLKAQVEFKENKFLNIIFDGFFRGSANYNCVDKSGNLNFLNKKKIQIKNISVEKKNFISSAKVKNSEFFLKIAGWTRLDNFKDNFFYSNTKANLNQVFNVSCINKQVFYNKINFNQKNFYFDSFKPGLGNLINIYSNFYKSKFRINPHSVLGILGFNQDVFSLSDAVDFELSHSDMSGKIKVSNIGNNSSLNNQIIGLNSDCCLNLQDKKIEFKNILIKFNQGQIVGNGDFFFKDNFFYFNSKIENVLFVNNFFKTIFSGYSHFSWKLDENPFFFSDLKLNDLVLDLERGKDFFLDLLLRKKSILDQDFLLKKNKKLDSLDFYTKISLSNSIVMYNQLFSSILDCDFNVQGNFKEYEGLRYKIFGSSLFKSGNLNFLDQNFFFKNGVVNFDTKNAYGPYFDFNFKTKKDRFSIGAHCFGNKNDFKVCLSSSPFLKEEKIVSMICGGSHSESFFQIFPDLLFQSAARAVDFSNYSSRVKKTVKSVARVCKKIQFVPQFIDNKASSIGGGLNINLNKNISANLKKSFSSQNDLSLNLEYLISDGLSFKFQRAPTGNLSSGIECCLKF